MKPLELSIGEPFVSPAWGSNFAVFSGESGVFIPESESREYLARCSAYAIQHQVYLVPERIVVMDYHTLCMLAPDGRVLGAQQGIYRADRFSHFKQGTSVDLVQTEFGTIFLCVDVDIYYPEVAKVAVNSGAQYIISSQGILSEDYSSHTVISGVWSASQNNSVYVIGVSNQFNAIVAPRIIKQYSQGFVVSPTQKTPLTATLSSLVLAHLPAKPALSRKLYSLHQAELLKG